MENKHTKGRAEVTLTADKIIGIRTESGFICFLTKPTRYTGQDDRYKKEVEENKANGELIADAFNVATVTELTPLQLVRRNQKMHHALIRASLLLTERRIVYKGRLEAQNQSIKGDVVIKKFDGAIKAIQDIYTDDEN